MLDKNKNLYYLDELSDYKVASHYCDVRGWDVKDAGNRTVGKVDDLLVNKQAERVVYLDVEVDESLIGDGYNANEISAVDGAHGFINKDGDDHLIIPVGMVSLDEENKKVLANEMDYNTFTKIKRFSKGAIIDRSYELDMFRQYVGDDTIDSTTLDDRFYNRKEFDSSLTRRKV